MPKTATHRVLLALPLVSIVAAACAPGVPDAAASGGARLELVLGRGRLEVLRGTPMTLPPDAPPAAVGDTDLRWSLVDASGAEVAAGHVADPRRFHFDTYGADLEAGTVLAEVGTITLELPDVDGTLRLVDADGHLLGERALARLGGKSYAVGSIDDKADINLETDVIGAPVLLLGDGATEGRFNLLVMPEGYTVDQLAGFHDDVAALIVGLRTAPGYQEHIGQINLWYQDIQSKESGISDPASALVRKTAFDITFGDDQGTPRRCLLPSAEWKSTSAFNMAHFADLVAADVVVIIANTEEHGGCANQAERFIIQSRGSNPARTIVHELGHALIGLADEYDYGTASPVTCRSGPNVSLDASHPPWLDLVAAGTPLPTPLGYAGGDAVGSFEGGGYCAHGAWRPQENCLMKSLDHELCAVCRRELERRFAQRAEQRSVVSISNRASFPVWVRCDGSIGPRCSGFEELQPGASVELKLIDGAFVIHGEGAGIAWNGFRVVPRAAQVSIYDNASDPSSPPGSDGPDAGLAETADAGADGADASVAGCQLAEVVVNEVQTAGASTRDEFVELFNPCPTPISLAGSKLVYRASNATGPADSALLAELTGTIAAGGTYVLAGSGFAGAAQVKPMKSGLPAAGGAVGLRGPSGQLIDACGWGQAQALNPLVEGSAASAPPAKQSIARVPHGNDSNHNATDFFRDPTPTPGAANP